MSGEGRIRVSQRCTCRMSDGMEQRKGQEKRG
jgi:hypothetical protein